MHMGAAEFAAVSDAAVRICGGWSPHAQHTSPDVSIAVHDSWAGQQPPAHWLLVQLLKFAQLASGFVMLPPHC